MWLCPFRRAATATCNTWNTCCSTELTWAPRMHLETLHCMCVLSTTRYQLLKWICSGAWEVEFSVELHLNGLDVQYTIHVQSQSGQVSENVTLFDAFTLVAVAKIPCENLLNFLNTVNNHDNNLPLYDAYAPPQQVTCLLSWAFLHSSLHVNLPSVISVWEASLPLVLMVSNICASCWRNGCIVVDVSDRWSSRSVVEAKLNRNRNHSVFASIELVRQLAQKCWAAVNICELEVKNSCMLL